ncbi:membrane protein [Flavobacterium sp. KMS]|nr:membrane protein [Flavobacterium sp. KMS]
MKKIVTSALLLIGAIAFAQKPIFTTAKVKAATVYFNAAEISQTASANLPLGTSEIVIKNVAVDLNENSIQIGTPSTVTVLSVQFTNNYISEYEVDTKSPALKRVRDSIVLVQKELQKVNNTINSETKTIQLLDKNQQISGVNSGLNVTELMKMVEYYKNKQIEIANTINTLTEKQQKLNETLQKLNNKLEVDTSKEEKTSSGKLIVQVMNEVAGAVPLDISYLTNNATWTPFYDLRAESVTSPINMMYKAQVIQNTGIDWKKVKLTLSSGYPNQNNQAPILSSWFLRNNNISQPYAYQQKSVMNQLQGRVAEDNALMETVVVAPVAMKKSSVSDYTTVEENQLNVSFDIDIPYDILSNGKVHSVSLKEIKLPSSYKYYAAPRVENEAFLLAEIADYSKYNLLRGEANIIFEGMYVGKTFIEPSQTSDTLNLSMGRDKKVSIKREKVADKSGTKFLSSKKEQTFTYDITVRNNKKEAIELLLKDQYPLTTNKEIEVELLQSDSAKVNSETGILTWQLQMKPNEIKKFRISYKVRYPKDQVLNL